MTSWRKGQQQKASIKAKRLSWGRVLPYVKSCMGRGGDSHLRVPQLRVSGLQSTSFWAGVRRTGWWEAGRCFTEATSQRQGEGGVPPSAAALLAASWECWEL